MLFCVAPWSTFGQLIVLATTSYVLVVEDDPDKYVTNRRDSMGEICKERSMLDVIDAIGTLRVEGYYHKDYTQGE